MKKLSVIIVSYNTKKLTLNCLASIKKNEPNFSYEVIVVDNGSSDGSVEAIQKKYSKLVSKLIQNNRNLGFAKANNRAKKVAQGKYILFLNPDTEVQKNTLQKTVDYMDEHVDTGALSCKLVLLNGKLDPDLIRSFPTPWVALTHFSGLSKLFPKYRYGHLDKNIGHEVDVIQAAFLLTRKNLLDKVGWFDEDYFMDGEDIDLCWKIKQKGKKIIYYPEVATLHIKKGSKREQKT